MDKSEVEAAGAELGSDKALNVGISFAVAIAGTFMALCEVKSGNVAQAIENAQSQRLNEWSYFQAKSTKQSVAEGALDQLVSLRSVSGSADLEALKLLDGRILDLKGKIDRYEREKGEIQVKAKKSEDDYIRFSEIDDQFDASAAAMSVGIALSGVSALVSSRRLFVGAVVFLALGIALGVAGFLGVKLTLPFLGDWLAA
ncbi:MAG: hypothetical protein RIS92_3044 [Verrucomicrobiota bacterium]|jgi:hypothetical protein